MNVDEVAGGLYALPPDEFVAARSEAVADARRAGDRNLAREIGALRRPTVGAWLVNLLAHQRPELVDELLTLGAALRTAQRNLRGDELRELSGQRRAMVSALARESRALAVAAGRGARDALPLAEVEATLTAALADSEVGELVRSGRLVKTVEYAGFGEVPRPQLRLLRGGVDGEPTTARPADAGQLRDEPSTAPPAAGGRADAGRADAGRAEGSRGKPAEKPADTAVRKIADRTGGKIDDRADGKPADRAAGKAALKAEEAALKAEKAALKADKDERRAAEKAAREAAEEAERRAAEREAARQREAERRRRQQEAHRDMLAARTALAEAEAVRVEAERAVLTARRRVEKALAAVEASRVET